MKKLKLDELKNGLPGVSKNIAAFLVEAAVICLDQNGHRSGVEIIITGIRNEIFQVEWSDSVSPELVQSWQDLKEATEYGATALAVLLVHPITGLYVTGRVPQSEQSDYILQNPEKYTQGVTEPDAFLEVSGIFKEKVGNTLNMRIQKKKKHIQKGARRNYPTYVIVVEFSSPKSKIIKV